jgi:CheY-like chemotaxis protein
MYDARRVLVVDAGQPGFRTLRALLVSGGFAVDCCGSAAGALRIVEEHLFDAAVVDLSVADMDPLVLCAFLRKVQGPRRALIVAVAGGNGATTYAEAMMSGCDTVLQGPVEPSGLALLLMLLTAALAR